MELNILNEKDNPLLQRKEIVISLEQFDATPSRSAVLEALQQKYNSPHILIDKIEHSFGSKSAKVFAKVYASAEALKEYDSEYKLQRGRKKNGQEGKKT